MGLVSIWFEKTPIEDSWIDRSELQKIDPDIFEQYESFSSSNSIESSSFQPGENDADIMRSSKPPTKPNSKAWKVYLRRLKRTMVFNFRSKFCSWRSFVILVAVEFLFSLLYVLECRRIHSCLFCISFIFFTFF